MLLHRNSNKSSNNGDPLAQLVEHNTFNVGVLGSSPKRITRERSLTSFFVSALYSHPRVLSPLRSESVSFGAEREPQADHKKG